MNGTPGALSFFCQRAAVGVTGGGRGRAGSGAHAGGASAGAPGGVWVASPGVAASAGLIATVTVARAPRAGSAGGAPPGSGWTRTRSETPRLETAYAGAAGSALR